MMGHGQADCPNMRSALKQGIRLGVHCVSCCGGFVMILFATGVMNLWTMGAIAVAITAERLVPWPALAARAIAAVIIAVGIVLVVQALCAG